MKHPGKTAFSRDMVAIGIRQKGDPLLREPMLPYDLPAESEIVHEHLARLRIVADKVAAAHSMQKGLGVAAPQIGVAGRIALVRLKSDEEIVLINPQIIGSSPRTDVRYEGCLSFFDVRGLVPRSRSILVRGQDLHGKPWEQEFTNDAARHVSHEIDHLDGTLYPDRLVPPNGLITLAEYQKLPPGATDWSCAKYRLDF